MNWNIITKLIQGHFECQRGIYGIFICTSIVLSILSVYNILYKRHGIKQDELYSSISLNIDQISEIVLDEKVNESRPRNSNCSIWTCVNTYRCGSNHITVYVYPLHEYINEQTGYEAAPLSKEFHEILKTIVESPYYTTNPNEACLLVPSIDLLNQNKINVALVNKALASLKHWNNGQNHILINMLSGTHPNYNTVIDVNTDESIILGSGFDTWSYRFGFDVAIPMWSPLLKPKMPTLDNDRDYLLIIAQLNILPKQLAILEKQADENNEEILFLKQCDNHSLDRCTTGVEKKHFKYPKLLSKGIFCFLGPSIRLGQPDLLEMMAYNCIPVIAVDNYILPFEDFIDWSLASIRINEDELYMLIHKLKNVSKIKINEMQAQVRLLYNNYFNSLKSLTITSLQYLECRIFPHKNCNKHEWNFVQNFLGIGMNPMFLSRVVVRSEGFTAVILTYDRVDSLFLLIEKLSLVSSLHSILVVWNNQEKAPPLLSAFPVISRPLKIIRTHNNRLSNRFFPYKDIETEAILSIDDDINMLTADEVDFGFEVWREFSDRIVGFPSRLHVWENMTSHWRYESEWTNQISMVLTGAAFYHKYWNHMYTYNMPSEIRNLVDGRMNCEDIAMNFLVANMSNKSPIKVTPRKKFKCPECINNEMLSADLNHMRERSRCIDEFTSIFGRMPLRAVEFRADPVLFKDNFPEKLKRFSDMGTL